MVVEYKGDKTDIIEPGEEYLGVYKYIGMWKENTTRQSVTTITYKLINNQEGYYISYEKALDPSGLVEWEGWTSLPMGFLRTRNCNTTHFENCPGEWGILTTNVTAIKDMDYGNLVVKCSKICSKLKLYKLNFKHLHLLILVVEGGFSKLSLKLFVAIISKTCR